jgi:tetratricopeptide (TPR) repeat protein
MKSSFRSSFATLAAALMIVGMVGCAGATGGLGEAREALRANNYDQALALVDTVLVGSPNDMDALALRAGILRQQAGAATDLTRRRAILRQFADTVRRAEAIDPADGRFEFERLQAWDNELQRGGAAFSEGQQGDQEGFVRAAAHFEGAHIVGPDTSSLAALYHGLTLIAAGQAERAIDPLRIAIERGEESTDAYVYLSRIYLQEDRPSDAVRTMEMAAERFPDNETISTELLNTYVRAGQPERALGAYQDAVRRAPDNATLRYNYGSLLIQVERYDEAIEQLERAAQLDASNANIQFNLGAAYQNKAASIARELDAITTVNEESRRLTRERDDYLQRSVTPLEHSRRLTVAAEQSPAQVCEALFRVYTQLNRQQDAADAARCAGLTTN